MKLYLTRNEEYSLSDEDFTIATNPDVLKGNIYFIEGDLEKGISFQNYWDTFQPYDGEFDDWFDLVEELADRFGYDYSDIQEVIDELGYQETYYWTNTYSKGKLVDKGDTEFNFEAMIDKCVEKLEK